MENGNRMAMESEKQFPTEWQEIVLFDKQTGEKHIADVQTIHNLVIEFQYSAINQEESISREKFYKNMIWIVDGTSLKRDYPRFQKELKILKEQIGKVFFLLIF